MRTHALLAPSTAHRWLRCPGSVALEAACPAIPAEYANEFLDGNADESAAAHELAATALLFCTDAAICVGERIQIAGQEGGRRGDREWEVTAGMAGHVQTYIDYMRGIGGGLLVEQRLNLEPITGEADATATADAVILTEHELIVADLDYGRDAKAQAEANARLQIHALAALDEFAFLGDFQRVRLIVVQPRLDHIDEWACSVAELHDFGQRAKRAAAHSLAAAAYHHEHRALRENDLTPDATQCRSCKAQASCPALTAHVLSTVAGDLVDIREPLAPQIAHTTMRTFDNATLGKLLGTVELIEGWCKAIRAKAESGAGERPTATTAPRTSESERADEPVEGLPA